MGPHKVVLFIYLFACMSLLFCAKQQGERNQMLCSLDDANHNVQHFFYVSVSNLKLSCVFTFGMISCVSDISSLIHVSLGITVEVGLKWR